jgi:NAD-dependent dihydropyrimidine dehydrogenase PreA subunit
LGWQGGDIADRLVPEIDMERCNGCGDCVKLCPNHARGFIGGVAVLVRPEECEYCTICESVCSLAAIRCPWEVVLEPPLGGSQDLRRGPQPTPRRRRAGRERAGK